MKHAVKVLTILALTIGLAGCDSSEEDTATTRPSTPSNVISGFYLCLKTPAESTVSYKVMVFNEYGTQSNDPEAQVLEAATAGEHVIDLFEAGADPHGVAVSAQMTSGTGDLQVTLYKDSETIAQGTTDRLNHAVYVNGGSAPSR